MLKEYALFKYELFCGEFNDRHLQSGSVLIDVDWDDNKIMRSLRKEWNIPSGTRISDNSDDMILYLENRRGETIGELVPGEYVCQPWSK